MAPHVPTVHTINIRNKEFYSYPNAVHSFTFYQTCFYLITFVPESSSGSELLPEHRAPSKPTVRQTASPQCPCENGAVGIMSSKYQVIMYWQPRGLWWRPGKLQPPAKLQWPPLRV